jgi:hypothetical protein
VGVTRALTVITGVLAALLLGVLVPATAQASTATAPPVISGTAAYRETLTVVPGTWTPPPTALGYQWLRDGQPVAGATGPTYRLGLADIGHTVTVVETATDATGSASAASAPTPPVSTAAFAVAARLRAAGVARQGRRLRARGGTVAPHAAHRTFQWHRDGRRIPGATRAAYRLGVGDVGHAVTVTVTMQRPGFAPLTLTSPPRTVDYRVPQRRLFTYSVATRGPVSASVAEFRRQAQETYADPRGWRAAGFAFQPVRRGGDFTLVLATAGAVPSFSGTCSSTWSCRVGRFVVINQTRWLHASPAWNAAHLPLRAYRHMVVDHETGHWLGHPHASCPGHGPAPVMMQQSKGLGGCRFNPWPLPRERWTSR